MVDRLANRRVEESNETLDNRWDILQMQPLRYQLISIQEQDFNSPRRVIIRESGEGHGRHVVEPHATTSQPSARPMTHHSHAILNAGREARMNEIYHFAWTMVEESLRENDVHADSNFPASKNYGRYLEG